MENEKVVFVGGVALTSRDVLVLSCVLEQYIYHEEHLVCSDGEVIKLDSPAYWGKHPLAPILHRLNLLSRAFDEGDSLFIKKSCS